MKEEFNQIINQSTIQLIECPRDAMQGWKHFIPTDKKIEYINSLLEVGFDTIVLNPSTSINSRREFDESERMC